MFKPFAAIAALAIALTGPSVASASAPLVATDGAHATSTTTAVVEGDADPNGQKTTLRVYYAQASSRWCTSGGTKGIPSKTVAVSIGSGNAMISEISLKVTGLAPNTQYCAELVAHNKSGTAYGGQLSFMTPSE